ncbi:protein timeless homolog isoform X2 [Pomacea canaliculata]|uniref:protein timeless homolog isoform X2 n=1 Tax=Pomacea canaliculata TaxID=400727 RepID=UPI000D7303F9|nr:protein timeless homolog isoform X2 [Pomacea canaliculata]
MVMHVELQATCSALGYLEGNKYIKEPDCLETVKELIRFLRREDDTCDIRRQLGDAQILQKDLVPLVKQYHNDKPIFDAVIRLMVNLTQPVIVCFNNQLPDEKTLRQHCLEVESHLQQYKEAFADEEFFVVLTKKLSELLELDWEHRHEEDKLLLERLIVLVRNVVHIPPDPASEQRTDDDASLHDQVLWAMHVSGMEDVILYIASSNDERQLCMHVLEIISLMFREQSPEILAHAGVQRSLTEKEKDERELEVARAREKAQKKSNLLKFNTRHSNFGGTYIMTNTKSLSDRELIYHKSIQDVQNFSLDMNKKPRKKPKNRQPITDKPVIRRSTLSIRLSLKEFCVQFLENAYNPLMYAVKDNLAREATQDLDETYYLWAMQFFMAFCRHHSKHVDFVSETMSVSTFHFIFTNLLRYFEMIVMEKKEAKVWGRRVHLALKAYQELLLTLDMMDKSNNSHLCDASRVIKSNVFYMMEFRDIFITLLKKFDQTKNSREYLKDLVETTHLFLRMLENYTKTNAHLVVRGKKKGKGKKKKTAKASAQKNKELSEQQLEDMWEELSSELSALLQGREEIPQNISPFDAASDVSIDQQRVHAMMRIHSALRHKQACEAVAVFRAAREVWPDRNEFGSEDITAEEEFMALREIFMAPLPYNAQNELPQSSETNAEIEEEQDEEREEIGASSWEQEFNFTAYFNNYAKPEILKHYVLLAADFEKNSTHTNHCVVKMLHRIGFDLGYIAMLFQASLFRVFQRLMSGPLARSPKFQEMFKFAVHVVRRFTEVAEKNRKVFMEMLFWKGNKEALQITEGYSYETGKAKVLWTEDEENQLTKLFEDIHYTSHPGQDTADLILERWEGKPKTRMQIVTHLKNLHLITSALELKQKALSARAWVEEDEQELAQAFEDNKESDDPIGNILAALTKKRSKPVVTEKLLSLGLINDRSEVRKKRGGKGSNRQQRKKQSEDDDSEPELREDREGFDEEGTSMSSLLPTDEESTSDSDDSSDEMPDEENGTEEGSSHSETEENSLPELSSTELLVQVLEKGYRNQVTWIERLLCQNADLREKGGKTYPVPIVPLTEDNETALEDPIFTGFIKCLGLSPPSNEQQMFWRIPAELSAVELNNIAKGLMLDEQNQLIHPEYLASLKPVRNQASGCRKKYKKKRQKMEGKRKTKISFDSKNEKRRKKIKKCVEEKKSSEKGKTTAAQRREVLKAMLERRRENGPSNRRRGRISRSHSQDRSDETVAAEEDMSLANESHDQTNLGESADSVCISAVEATSSSSSPAPRKQTKRIKRMMVNSDSESDDDNRLVIDHVDDNSALSTSRRSAKRIRLLESDDSNDSLETSTPVSPVLNGGQASSGPDEGDESNASVKKLAKHRSRLESDSSDDNIETSVLSFRSGKDDMDQDRGPALILQSGSGNDENDGTGDRPLTRPETFPATLYTQGPPNSDDSETDDHIPLRVALKKAKKIISDDEDD